MRFKSDQEYDIIDSMAHQKGELGSKVHHHRAVRNSLVSDSKDRRKDLVGLKIRTKEAVG